MGSIQTIRLNVTGQWLEPVFCFSFFYSFVSFFFFFCLSFVLVAPASGMARYRDPIFHLFVRSYIRMSVRPSTFATTLASTLLFKSVTLKPYEIV